MGTASSVGAKSSHALPLTLVLEEKPSWVLYLASLERRVRGWMTCLGCEVGEVTGHVLCVQPDHALVPPDRCVPQLHLAPGHVHGLPAILCCLGRIVCVASDVVMCRPWGTMHVVGHAASTATTRWPFTRVHAINGGVAGTNERRALSGDEDLGQGQAP